jgi:hypothetical protein
MSRASQIQDAITALLGAPGALSRPIPVVKRIPGDFKSDVEAASKMMGICIHVLPVLPTKKEPGTALGDEAAFTAFVNRRRPQLVRAAASVVGPFDAEDVAQLTLIHLWGIASRFRFLCEVEAWVHTMARRQAGRWLRRGQVRATLSLEERMAESHWEPVSRDMPPWGGLFLREIEEEEARQAAQNS